jgi:hypothetical protein
MKQKIKANLDQKFKFYNKEKSGIDRETFEDSLEV